MSQEVLIQVAILVVKTPGSYDVQKQSYAAFKFFKMADKMAAKCNLCNQWTQHGRVWARLKGYD